ncbi:hypothetical protein FQZ97_785330 [compost metagenome]
MREEENMTRLDLHPGVSTHAEGFSLDWKDHGRFRVESGKHIFYNEKAAGSGFFEHFLVNEVMAGIFFQRGYFLLHGSAALLPDGTAAVFFGEPGAGKSTTLGFFVKHGCRVLTDEIVIIHFREGLPYIQPFIPILRLWDSAARRLGYTENKEKKKYEIEVEYSDSPVPLKAAFSLRKNDHFHIGQGLTHREHLDLFGNFPLPKDLLSPKEQAKRFQQSADIIRACGVFQVSRTDHSFDAIDQWVSRFLA